MKNNIYSIVTICATLLTTLSFCIYCIVNISILHEDISSLHAEYKSIQSHAETSKVLIPELTSIPVENLEKSIITGGGTVRLDEYGIEIDIPEGWQLTTNNTGSAIFTVENPTSLLEGDPYGDVGDVRIILRYVSTSTPIQTWFEKNELFNEDRIQESIDYMAQESTLDPPLSKSDIVVRIEETRVDNKYAISQYIRAEKPLYIEGGPQTTKTVYVAHAGHIYEFKMITRTGAGTEQIIDEFDKIIDTITLYQSI